MLVVPTKLLPSPIHGLGLFADGFIPKGTVVWRFDPRIDRVYGKEEVEAFPYDLRAFLKHYSCLCPETDLWVFCGDNARFVNHSESPNLYSSGNLAGSVALRDIKDGEEITDNYGTITNEELPFVGNKDAITS